MAFIGLYLSALQRYQNTISHGERLKQNTKEVRQNIQRFLLAQLFHISPSSPDKIFKLSLKTLFLYP